MQYRRTFINQYLHIKIHTNSKRIYKLIENFLDFDDSLRHSKPRINVNFYLNEIGFKNPNDSKDFLYQSRLDENKNLLSSFGNSIARVTTNPKTRMVKATVVGYKESSKEHILDFILMQPLRFILAHHGLFFLHASVVCKDRDCILIIGGQNSGKSTLALTLARNGFKLLADDDCFVKLIRNQLRLFPFPTKMGLNDKILKRFPEFTRHTLKNYRYGGKHRISLMHMSSSSNIKGLRCKTIIFPRYKENRSIYMKKISQEEALGKLSKESLVLNSKEEFKKIFAKNFWTIYNLTRQADCFELLYDDNNLDKIADSIKKSGNFED